jgi:transcription factor SPN1
MQIEAILKPKKASRQRKKKKDDEVLDSFADAEVARLRENMNTAADEDIRANSEKHAAMSKLKLLPEAMETLRKYVSITAPPPVVGTNVFILLPPERPLLSP